MSHLTLLLGLVLAPGGARGIQVQAPADSLPLTDAVTLARSANPGLIAARLRADAASERIAPAGALPDPQLTLGLMNRPIGSFGTDEPMTMNQVQVTQMFPWPGKLGWSRERVRHLALAESHSALETEAVLVSRVRTVYYELAAMDRSIAIMEQTRELLRDFFQVSQAMYSVGEGLQQDVLQAQVAVARMTEDITVMVQRRVAMAARLNALLGRGPETPVGRLALPPVGVALPPVDSLMTVATGARPALLAAAERTRAAQAGYQAARKELFPDLMVGLAYGQRPQFDDMGSLMVGVSIPLWSGAKQIPMRREMAAMQAMESAMAQDLYNDTFAELTDARAEAEQARELGQLYATAVLPQARAAVESALSAYRVGRVDYMTLVENEMTVNRYEIELVRIAAQYHQAVSRIDALLGRTGGER